jgi:ribonuclease-3
MEEQAQPALDELETLLGVRFRRRELLQLALIHHSVPHGQAAAGQDDDAPSNERLEFLGDAVLGAAAAAYLYHAHPELAEGPLSALRSALVRRSTVARYADDVTLGNYVYVGPGEEGPQGRGAASVLSAAFEAVVGAIFLDQGFTRAARFLTPYFRRYLPLIVDANLHVNAKSQLQEYSQGRYRITPSYRLLDRSGPSHDSRFVSEAIVEGIGSAVGQGINRQAAEQDAAVNLLGVLLQIEESSPVGDEEAT